MDMNGRHVRHTKFGTGTIKSCENGVIQIYFDQYGARFFHYPEVFAKFITTDDDALAIQVNADLTAWQSTRAAEDIQLAESVKAMVKAARTPIKKTAPRRKTPDKA